ncbi:MAG: ABC transporter ATP-binding protein [Clostridia bacterium]|jgi:putative ABC transport system ATP-binding protein|nr:ABC transporter ATP-binding protein [Clostridia bacterium]MCI2014094.1 ABC transporter ATP-binding protein [Clostridia bacterium]
MLDMINVRKIFSKGTANEKMALDRVNFSMDEADFVTVIGGNGAGKSTILNAIAGLFFVDSGKIIIDGHDVTKLPEHKRAKYIGRVFQDPRMGTATNMSIEENLAMALRRGQKRGLKKGITHDEKDKFRTYLEELDLGLENRMSEKAGLLSGGQRQAVTLIMATMTKPKLLLLDEHTAALDPKTAKKVLDLTRKIVAEDKLTALMVTHNMRDAIKYGNRLMMMHNGNVLLDLKEEKKKNLEVGDLLMMFEKASGQDMSNDRVLLS